MSDEPLESLDGLNSGPLVEPFEPLPVVVRGWKIHHFLILIVLLALGFAGFGIAPTVLLAVLASPVVLARRGYRLSSLYWVGISFPLCVLAWLYVVWFHGWIALGHPPRSSLDDPKNINSIEYSYLMMYVLLIITPFVFLISLGLTLIRVAEKVRSGSPWAARLLPLLLFPLTWGLSYFALRWDPYSVLEWFFD